MTNNFENDANTTNAWLDTDQELRIDTINGEKTLMMKMAVPAQARVPPSTTRSRPDSVVLNQGDKKEEGDMDYIPRWARSSKPKHGNEDSGQQQDSESDSEQFCPTDELPPFADEASKALHREIKLLEQHRDEAASSTRSHEERIGIISDHLRSIRQEIEHTNSLVAAKKSEMDTEEHLLSLTQREIGQSLRDTSALEHGNISARENMKNVRTQTKSAEDELEKLRTDLNWNQEELEQWATAATKKEEESLALQKYTLADELKIKDLTLTIEDLTKLSVEKKTLLENEVTETKSNQTELEKLAERFKSRHDERRQLIQQWRDTIESMNNRDQTINEIAGQYAGFAQKEDESKRNLSVNREHYEFVENERDDSQQDIEYKERFLQSKRNDLSSLRNAEYSLKEEVDSLQRENSMVVASVEKKQAERKRALTGLANKRGQVGMLTKQFEDAKSNLTNEKLDTSSKELIAETIEKELVNREKDFQQAEKNIASLKNKMYKDSEKLADLRKQEADLIVDITGTQSNIKHFTSKANGLENNRARQQELLYNANFQLQQMEKKLARGLGERSNEELQKLRSQIKALETDLESEKQKKNLLAQQQRKIQSELRAWSKKHEASESKYHGTMQKIDGIGLEIFACEQSLKDVIAKKEEAMVAHDVTLLDVRRLRDLLRNLLEEVCSLKQQASGSLSSMQEKKDEMLSVNEVKMAQLRASKEERHKSAIDLGKLKITLEKTKAKYGMVSAVNAGEGGGAESPELKLILAAQKREELQQEGDKLDNTIQKKEKEIKAMKKTLSQLRERNTNFRSSFSRADMNGVKAQQLKLLESRSQTVEDNLFRARKEQQVLQKMIAEDKVHLDRVVGHLASDETKNIDLASSKEQFESDVDTFKSKLDQYSEKVSAYQNLSHQAMRELQYRKFHAELISIQADRIGQLLVNLGEEFPELREDILNDMKKMGLSEYGDF